MVAWDSGTEDDRDELSVVIDDARSASGLFGAGSEFGRSLATELEREVDTALGAVGVVEVAFAEAERPCLRVRRPLTGMMGCVASNQPAEEREETVGIVGQCMWTRFRSPFAAPVEGEGLQGTADYLFGGEVVWLWEVRHNCVEKLSAGACEIGNTEGAYNCSVPIFWASASAVRAIPPPLRSP